MPEEKDPWRRRGESVRKQSLALMIPSLWLGGPLGVGLLGYWLGGLAGRPSTGALVGVALGVVIAIRETVRITRLLSRDS